MCALVCSDVAECSDEGNRRCVSAFILVNALVVFSEWVDFRAHALARAFGAAGVSHSNSWPSHLPLWSVCVQRTLAPSLHCPRSIGALSRDFPSFFLPRTLQLKPWNRACLAMLCATHLGVFFFFDI